jgi:hypothetical protein
MDHRDILGGIVSPEAFLADHEIRSTRRGLLVAPLLAALSLALSDEAAIAGTINPSETQITLPGAIKCDDWVAGLPAAQRRDGNTLRRLDSPDLISC